MRQRWPATATRVCSGTGRGAVAAQVGEFAGDVVAADQQMVHAGVGVVFAQQPNQAHEYSRGPCAPAPAEWRCQARAGISAGSASARIGPAWVGTRRLAATART